MKRRLRRIAREEMTLEQITLVDTPRTGPAPNRLTQGPYLTWFHLIDLAQKMSPVMPYWHEMAVDYGLSEMATAMVARAWNAQYAWCNHAGQAAENGVDKEIMEAIKNHRRPTFRRASEEAVYDFVTEILETRRVSDKTYERVKKELGEIDLIDIVQVSGFYSLVSMNEAIFGDALPEGVAPPLHDIAPLPKKEKLEAKNDVKPRIKLVDPASMSPEMRALVEERPVRAVEGPFTVWFHRPKFAKKMGPLMPYWHEMKVNYGLSEMATAMVARAWQAQYAWFNHEKQSRDNGIDPDVIAAIKARRKPVFKHEGEEVVYNLVTEIIENRAVRDATYDRAKKFLGEAGLIEIVQVVGFYTLVSMNEAVFGVGMPEGTPYPLKD
jgi:4-carboxymuconolactone decarboxylase